MPSELYAVADCQSYVTYPPRKLILTVCLIPMGLPTPSVGPEIAECQRILEKSGLEFKIHGYGTNVEGPWDEVTKAIGDCHRAVHAMGTPRIAVCLSTSWSVPDRLSAQTDIRIGTRIDKTISAGGNAGKVKRVEDILSAK
ncbi:hypothetical protein P7C73_g5705, partial [Tremellales sp. Uapishka_1]